MRTDFHHQKKELNEMINKNQDWFFPILSAISLWGISVWMDLTKNTKFLDWCFNVLILTWITTFFLTLLLVLINLFITIYFTTKVYEWGYIGKNKDFIDSTIKITFIISFISTIVWMMSLFLYYISIYA